MQHPVPQGALPLIAGCSHVSFMWLSMRVVHCRWWAPRATHSWKSFRCCDVLVILCVTWLAHRMRTSLCLPSLVLQACFPFFSRLQTRDVVVAFSRPLLPAPPREESPPGHLRLHVDSDGESAQSPSATSDDTDAEARPRNTGYEEDTARYSAAAKALGLHPRSHFVSRVNYLAGLLSVHDVVLVMGGEGSGKSALWRTLAHAEGVTTHRISPSALGARSVEVVTALTSARNSGAPMWVILEDDAGAETYSAWDPDLLDTLSRCPNTKVLIESCDVSHASPAQLTRIGIVCMDRQVMLRCVCAVYC